MKKIADTYFFSIRIMPFSWVMDPWKNTDEILSANISKTIEARALKPAE